MSTENERWLTDGDCSKCRRKEYCTFDKMVNGICHEVDYLIILNDNSQPIKRLFMSYKQTGKHGSMIEL